MTWGHHVIPGLRRGDEDGDSPCVGHTCVPTATQWWQSTQKINFRRQDNIINESMLPIGVARAKLRFWRVELQELQPLEKRICWAGGAGGAAGSAQQVRQRFSPQIWPPTTPEILNGPGSLSWDTHSHPACGLRSPFKLSLWSLVPA